MRHDDLDYLIVGHVTVDTINDHGETLGGSVLYAAIAARNLGARVGVHTSAADEPSLLEAMSNVMVNRVPAQHSTRFNIRYDHLGMRHQSITGVAEKLSLAQVPREWRHTRLVHLAPVCQEIDATLINGFPDAFMVITPQGWLRHWDGCGEIRPRHWPDEDRMLGRANAVVVSEEDLNDPAVIRQWAQKTANLVVTRADCGCDVYLGDVGEPYHSPAFSPARLVDPTGAGDAFAAAYFWSLLQGRDPVEAADWANCFASFVVEGQGPSIIPTLEDVQKRWIDGKRI